MASGALAGATTCELGVDCRVFDRGNLATLGNVCLAHSLPPMPTPSVRASSCGATGVAPLLTAWRPHLRRGVYGNSGLFRNCASLLSSRPSTLHRTRQKNEGHECKRGAEFPSAIIYTRGSPPPVQIWPKGSHASWSSIACLRCLGVTQAILVVFQGCSSIPPALPVVL